MEKEIGAEGKLVVSVCDGKVHLKVLYDGKGVDGSVGLSVDAEYLVDKIAEAIPGDSALEASVVMALKLALKSVKL